MSLQPRTTASFVAILFAVLTAADPAGAVDVAQCSAAFDAVQSLRGGGKLIEAKREALTCVQEQCPAPIQAECRKWLPQIEQDLPTIILRGRDADGNDVANARLLVDGVRVADALDGKPLPMDPGPHKFRLERDGSEAVEVLLVIATGEKNRIVASTFKAPSAAEAGGPARAIPAGVWVFGALGVASAASFATFATVGRSQYSSLSSSCGTRCSSSDVSGVRATLLVADVSLGVAVVSLGAAAWMFFTRPAPPAAAAGVSVSFAPSFAPTAGGVVIGAAGAF